MRQRENRSWFSAVSISLTVLVVVVLAVTGLVLYQRHNTRSAKNSAATSPAQTTTQPQSTVTQSAQPNPSQGWNTYNDTGYAAASGINMQYPPDWEINIPGVKKVGNAKNPTAVINERVVYLPSSETPEQEWTTCGTQGSADACGPTPGDKTLSSRSFTINGFEAYTATMQNRYGTYHVTVIKSNKSISPAGVPFVELTTTSSDQGILSTYAKMTSSAKFSN